MSLILLITTRKWLVRKTDFDFKHIWVAPETFRAQSVIGSHILLDVKLEKRFKGSLPIEAGDWQVGVIVGSSGSGKTSLAKKLFGDAYIREFRYSHACFLVDFPENVPVTEIEKALCKRERYIVEAETMKTSQTQASLKSEVELISPEVENMRRKLVFEGRARGYTVEEIVRFCQEKGYPANRQTVFGDLHLRLTAE